MKKIIAFLAVLSVCFNSFADTKYCVMKVETDKNDMFHRYSIDVDYGEPTGPQTIYPDGEKEDWHFSSYVSAINKLAKYGWEVVSINETRSEGFIITLKKDEKKEEER